MQIERDGGNAQLGLRSNSAGAPVEGITSRVFLRPFGYSSLEGPSPRSLSSKRSVRKFSSSKPL